MYTVRRFGVVRTATIVAVMYMLVIAVIAVPIAIIAAVAGTAIGRDASGVGVGVGVGALVFALVIAVVYGAIGWVFTAAACLLYNLAAGWVGGVEVQLEAVVKAPPIAWGPTTTPVPPGSPPAG